MGNASQRHKLQIRGYNSLGERLGKLVVYDEWGSDTDSAKIIVEGLWDANSTATVNTDIGGGNVQSQYTPAGDEDAVAAASGLAAVINAQTDHTATSTENTIHVTKTTAGTVHVVNYSVA